MIRLLPHRRLPQVPIQPNLNSATDIPGQGCPFFHPPSGAFRSLRRASRGGTFTRKSPPTPPESGGVSLHHPQRMLERGAGKTFYRQKKVFIQKLPCKALLPFREIICGNPSLKVYAKFSLTTMSSWCLSIAARFIPQRMLERGAGKTFYRQKKGFIQKLPCKALLPFREIICGNPCLKVYVKFSLTTMSSWCLSIAARFIPQRMLERGAGKTFFSPEKGFPRKLAGQN